MAIALCSGLVARQEDRARAQQDDERPVLNDEHLVKVGFEDVAFSALIQVLPDLTGVRWQVQNGIGATRVTLIIAPTPKREMASAIAKELLGQGYLVQIERDVARISQCLLTKRLDPDRLVPQCDPDIASSALGTNERRVPQAGGIALTRSENPFEKGACSRSAAQSIRTFDDRAIESVIAEVAAKTGKWIAVAPQLLRARLSFSVTESAVPEEYFRDFIAALQSLGYRTIEAGNVATILPGHMPAPTPQQHTLASNFEGADIRMIAEILGPQVGRIIAVAWPTALPRKVNFQAGPGTPDEVYRQFVGMVQHLGYTAIVAGNVVTIVPAEAVQ